MRVSKFPLVFGFPLILGACAAAVPGIYTEPKAGFANISSQVTPAIGKRTAFAETQAEIRTITVGRAVLELDMTGYPVVLFRNAAHGGISVVYRRPDGNVGWIDPERTVKSINGQRSVKGSDV